MTDTVKVNSQTGQVAILRGDGWHVYSPGMYKISPQTGQIAVLDAKASGYEIHDAPDAISKLNSPEGILARSAGSAGMGGGPVAQPFTSVGGQPVQPDTPGTTQGASQGESALRGAAQGITLGTSDEIGGSAGALVNSLMNNQVPIDPAHPVTGGMSNGFGANYLSQVGQERELNQAAKENNPKSYKGSFFAGALLPSLAMSANTMLQAGGSGAVQGGLLGAGLSDTQDLKKLLLSGGGGAAGGALLGAGMRGLQSVALDSNTPSGLAYNALSASAPGGDIGNIVTRPSSAPAELDPAMANLLRTAGSMNGDAAAVAIPAARDRMGNVNQAIIQRVGTDLSPLDAGALGETLGNQAQVNNAANYAAANASPVRVGLTPNVTDRPSFQDALRAAAAAAADENPPRQIDVTNLGARDIDLIDRMLQGAQRSATESRGDTSAAAQIAKALIPTRGQVAGDVRNVADAAFPELQHARAGAAEAFGLQDAIDTGRTWLASSKSAEQVGAEFNALDPNQQQAALAGFATDIRNTLGTKTARANLGQVFEKTALADKLRNVGMPDDVIDNIVRGGSGARDVLNALEGGSMTARNIAGKEALQSTLSGIKPGDITAGAVTGSPLVTAALPIMRNIGGRSEREAAALIVNALTQPGGRALASIVNRAPQTWGGLLNSIPRTTGGLLGTQVGFGQRFIGDDRNIPRVVLDQGVPNG